MPSQVPTQSRYSHLFADVEKGRIQIPQFQREFVWSRKKSASLIDSILKGYPIGAFIFWKTQERMRSVRSLGGFTLPPAPEGDVISLVLDGQQRLTSLFAAINGLSVRRSDGTTTDFSEIYVDLYAEEGAAIVSDEFEVEDTDRYIRLDSLIRSDPEDIIFYDKGIRDKIAQYRDNITGFQFPIIELKDAPIEIATEVFERVNVGGKPLTLFEIMVAKTYDEKQDFDLSAKFDVLLAELARVEFDTLSDASILQLISLLHNKEAKRQSILSIPKPDFIALYPLAEKGIKAAIGYCQNTLRIPVSRLMPYTTLLVPLALFFCKNDFRKPTKDQREYLGYLFWMAALSERYSSGVETKLGQDAQRVNTILNGKVPKFDWSVDVSPDTLLRDGTFNAGRSYIKAILCVYAYNRPLSFADNAIVELGNGWLLRSDSKNYHHFFPKAHLAKTWPEEEANHILNIVFVDDYLNKRVIGAKAPSKYLAGFRDENEALGETLKTHLIGAFGPFGLEDDNYPKFLRARAQKLSAALKKRLPT